MQCHGVGLGRRREGRDIVFHTAARSYRVGALTLGETLLVAALVVYRIEVAAQRRGLRRDVVDGLVGGLDNRRHLPRPRRDGIQKALLGRVEIYVVPSRGRLVQGDEALAVDETYGARVGTLDKRGRGLVVDHLLGAVVVYEYDLEVVLLAVDAVVE